MKAVWILVFLCSNVVWLTAQDIPWKNKYQRTKTLIPTEKTIVIDSISIISEGFTLKDSEGNPISNEEFQLDEIQATLTVSEKLLNKTLVINYFVNPNTIAIQKFTYDSLRVIDNTYQYTNTNDFPEITKEKSIFGNLQTQGSAVRGIFLGNNQNASTLSSLDLKLEGKLSKDVTIAAQIYDHNVPIESNGYTQNINEFENFFIEIYNTNSKLKAGFLDLVQTENRLANFTRKVMGISLSTQIQNEHSTTKIFASGSVSRGEFNRVQFNGIDGNQGPYKLNGKNGELFIVLLPNSEKVYWDGILLQAGEDKDYTLNNQTGELTFSTQKMVTAQSRITVEYQYTTQNYSRYLVYSGLEYNNKRWQIAGTVFSENDAKNSSGTQNLSDEEKTILAAAGDNTQLSFANTEVETAFESGKILYRKITLGTENIYEYSQDANETLYTLRFTYVGANNGNYKRSQLAVNGKVYEYIAPIGTQKQGDYEPIKQLIAPEKKQVYSVYGSYQLDAENPAKLLRWNVALSNRDVNAFSDLDDDNNLGFASNIAFQSEYTWKNWTVKPNIQYQFLQKNYTILDRIQAIEFNREFNRTQEFSFVNQHNIEVKLANSIGKHTQFSYQLNHINEDSLYKGTKNSFDLVFDKNSWNFSSKNAFLSTNSTEDHTSFLQSHQIVTKKIKTAYQIGAEFHVENNRRKLTDESYQPLSFGMQEIAFFMQKKDSQRFQFRTRLYKRNDDSIRNNALTNITKSIGNNWDLMWNKNENHRFGLDAEYRNVVYNQSISASVRNENFLIGKAIWSGNFLKKSLQINTQYILESGREAQREFQYVRVAEGQGIYKWTDYNQNGIEELDEFEVAEFQDLANYIRVFLNNVSYQKTNTTGLNVSLSITPEKWNTEGEFWKRMMIRSSYNSSTSYWKNNDIAEFNPFSSDAIFHKNQSVITSFQYNRISQHKWDFVYKYSLFNNTKTVFLGQESNERFAHDFVGKYRFLTGFTSSFQYNFGTIYNASELFTTRNYTIQHQLFSPSILYEYGKEISAKTLYRLHYKENTLGTETLTLQELGAELRYDKGKNSLVAKFSFIQNNSNSTAQSVVLNQMMEGLQQGNNMIWSVIWQRELTSFLMLNLNYQARKNEEYKTIHTGNIQLKALF